MKTTDILCALMLGATLASCNDVDICESKHPHQGEARFSFDWGEREADKPESMGVLAYRIVGQEKQFANLNTTTLKFAGNKDSIALSVGEYRFYALSLNDQELDYTELYDFIKGNGVDMPITQVGVTYRDYDISDPNLTKKLTGWDDFNSYAKYIQPTTKPLFYDSTQVMHIDRDEHFSYTFKPKSLSQDIDITFAIDKQIDNLPFVIDQVWAEISGVPRYITLSNCHLDITSTAKLMFPVALTSKNGSEGDSMDNTLLQCKGTISVPGLVNVQRQKGDTEADVMRKVHGPGIMQVIIYGHATDPTTGKTRRKKWQGIINLYQPIKVADLMYISPDGKYVTRKREHGTIKITAKLTIDGEKIISDSDSDNGLGAWIPTVDIQLDI